MKKLSRAKNTMRNTLWGAIYRVATLIGPFAIKTIIIKELGQEYNGLSTLFTSVLTVLNLANLGFNSSLVFTMYKAIAEDDKPALCAMLKFYRKVYRIVGLVILGMGLAVMPFLSWLVKNDCPPDMNLYVLFAIYLSESVLDYLMFAYNNATFTAFQRNDVTLKISTVRYVVQYTLQAAVLLIFSNYYAYIILLPLMVIPNNVAVYLAARKHYPDIVCQGELDPVTKKDIYKRVGTLFGHKLGNTFLVSIDSIIISSFLGLTALSLYSNYYYILTAVNGLVEIVTNGSLSGIGNKLLTDSREDNYRFFKTMTYGWVALVGGAAACMLCFYQPFIAAVWLGPEYLLDERLMMLIVLYFFSWMFRIMQLTYRDAAGLWTEDWLKPYVGMAVNLVGSIWMVKATGSIAGVLVPTILVFFFIYTPWEAWVVVKYQFYRSWNEYMGKLLGYVLLAFAACAACYLLEHGPRPLSRGCDAGRRGTPDHAESGPQHGVAAALHSGRPGGRVRLPCSGARPPDELHPLKDAAKRSGRRYAPAAPFHGRILLLRLQLLQRGSAVQRHLGDDGTVHPQEEQHRHAQRGDLRNGITPPHQIVVSDGLAVAGQHIGDGYQKHQLADDGGDHGVHRLPQCLEGTAQSDAGPGRAETQGDDPQGRNGHLLHSLRGIEDTDQRPRNGPEDGHTQHHDAGGIDGAALDGLHHAAAILSAVVIGHDRNHTVVQAEHRHKDKAVEFEVDAKGGSRRLLGGVVSDEDLVHAEGHHRADSHHHHGGQADGIDIAHDLPVRPEAPEPKVQIVVLPQVHIQSQTAAAELADNGGHSGTRHAHFEHEDEDGIQHDVDNGAQPLGIHGEDGAAGALQ